MTDTVAGTTRSKIMSRICSRNNLTTEQALASALRQHKIVGWRRHPLLPGTPDFSWPKNNVVVFVDGCFWHGCPKCYRQPKSNVKYWKDKVASNRRRDRRVDRQLRATGWKVLRIWECRLKKPGNQARVIGRIRKALTNP